jgi:hypothetical protein
MLDAFQIIVATRLLEIFKSLCWQRTIAFVVRWSNSFSECRRECCANSLMRAKHTEKNAKSMKAKENDAEANAMSESETNESTDDETNRWINVKNCSSQRIFVELRNLFINVFDITTSFFSAANDNDDDNRVENSKTANDDVSENEVWNRSKKKSTKIVFRFFFFSFELTLNDNESDDDNVRNLKSKFIADFIRRES